MLRWRTSSRDSASPRRAGRSCRSGCRSSLGPTPGRSRMENLETLASRGVLDVIEGRYSAGAGQADEARKGRFTLLHCELTDAGAVEKLISSVRPDRIFHLAAQSFVQSSFDEPAATMRINIESQLNVLEAVRRHDTKIRIHVAGSSEACGLVY